MDDTVFVETVREAQAILARHSEQEHPSSDETLALLLQLLDSAEVVKALAERGFTSSPFK